MHRYFQLLFLLILERPSSAQTVEDLTWPLRFELRVYDKTSLQLFDSTLIKAHGYTSATIIRVDTPNEAGEGEKLDTLLTYTFGRNGQPVEKTLFVNRQSYTTDLLKPEIDYPTGKRHTYVKQIGSGRKVIEHIFWPQIYPADTPITIQTQFDKEQRVLEKIVTPSKAYLRRLSCLIDEPPFHNIYAYDSIGRMILDKDLYTDEYYVIYYQSYGEEVSVYDRTTNELLRKEVAIIDENEEMRNVSTKEGQIILSFSGIESKLIKRVTIFQGKAGGKINYYEIWYN